MSDIITKHAGRKLSEVPPQDLRMIIEDVVKNAEFIMSANLDKEYRGTLVGWTYKYLNERFNYMPVNHVSAAFESGSMGHRGGTSKLIPRNIAIWINEQNGILQEQLVRRISQEDEKTRNENFNTNKAEWQVAAAVRIKVTWLGEGVITSEEYGSFSSRAIYDLLKSGVSEKIIRPRDVVPNYEEHRL